MPNKYFNQLKQEIKNNKLNYLVLSIILLGGFFARVYRVQYVLGFFYDQGRDAKVIWDLWHHGKLFLTGPTTGIAGILRGPFYFYLIAPFYLIGGGNPIWPSVFLAFTTISALALLYYLAMRASGRLAGLIAAAIGAFSFNITIASRWLSNPTPMLLLSMILVWSMYLVYDGKKWAWVLMFLTAGVSLSSFGSAGELFYFLAIAIFGTWLFIRDRKNIPDKKIIFLSLGALAFAAIPQVAFDIKHDGILRHNVEKFLLEDQSFKSNFWDVAKIRFNFFYDVFTNKIFHWRRKPELWLLTGVLLFFFKNIKKHLTNPYFNIPLLLLVSPMIGLLFFQGNEGNIYDYYLTGYYLVFVLVFAVSLAEIKDSIWGKIFIIVFFYFFFMNNVPFIKYRITDGVDGPESIGFKNQKQAIDWIYEDAGGQPFSIDVYVPPVIPHAYDYLFLWYGGKVKGYEPSSEMIDPLYTLYEVDPPHPERLEAWLERQAGIGEVEKETSYGGITVQKRKRIEQEN